MEGPAYSGDFTLWLSLRWGWQFSWYSDFHSDTLQCTWTFIWVCMQLAVFLFYARNEIQRSSMACQGHRTWTEVFWFSGFSFLSCDEECVGGKVEVGGERNEVPDSIAPSSLETNNERKNWRERSPTNAVWWNCCTSGEKQILGLNDVEQGVQPLACGHMWPRMAMNVAQHKTVNLLKTILLLFSFHQYLCI